MIKLTLEKKQSSIFFLVVGSLLGFVWLKEIKIFYVALALATLCLCSQTAAHYAAKLSTAIGKINSWIILGAFYFLALTPFSILYRLFFKHESFKKSSSTYVPKNNIGRFEEPF